MLDEKEELYEQLVFWGVVPPIHELNCVLCNQGANLRIRERSTGVSYLIRCKFCRKEYSLFKNGFFCFDKDEMIRMKLNIEKILKVIYFTFENKSIADLITLTGVKSKTTLIDWTNYIRKAAHLSVIGEMLGGEGKIVQIDESLMRGRRKNNNCGPRWGCTEAGESQIFMEWFTVDGGGDWGGSPLRHYGEVSEY